MPAHLTGSFSRLRLGPGAFSIAERAAQEMISLPIYPHVEEPQQAFVAQSLEAALRGVGSSVSGSANENRTRA